MGIDSLLLRNKALLEKWWWRFNDESDALLHKVIRSKYGMQENNWDAGLTVPATFRSPWKFISRIYPEFTSSIELEVRSNFVYFWEEKWCGNSSFPCCFLSLPPFFGSS